MYWYRPKLTFTVALTGVLMLAISGSGCKPDVKETGTLKYFDLSSYFKNEVIRLKKNNKPVVKTVTHNGAIESKQVQINNWERELELFTGSDINKPAWKNSYLVVNEDSLTFYKAKEPDLKVREMIIKKDKQKVKWILIYTKAQSFLYKTTEKLSYFPDSLYLIEKDQRVKLLGANFYKIQGAIGK